MVDKMVGHANQVSSGVEALVEQLREDGVNAGKAEADVLLKEAQARAEKLLLEAEHRASDIVKTAKAEAKKIEGAGNDALKIAMRDIILKLKAQLSQLVGDRVQHLIASELNQQEFLKELILELAARVREDSALDQSHSIEFKLPKGTIGLEELRHKPLELSEGSLSHFILNVAADVLREGVNFTNDSDDFYGLRVVLKDADLIVDLSDESLSSILLEHLQPRFRAILEGMVK